MFCGLDSLSACHNVDRMEKFLKFISNKEKGKQCLIYVIMVLWETVCS